MNIHTMPESMKIVLTISCLVFLIVWIAVMGWKVGYFRRLSMNLTIKKWRVHLSAPEKPQPTNKGFERRLLIEKSRPLLGFDLLLTFLWVVAAAISFALAVFFHSPYIAIAGAIIALLALPLAQNRFRVKYLTRLLLETHCPQCGMIPLDFVPRSHDQRYLLICKKCHIEWDIGSANQ
jgi:hypothetical protein